MRLYTKITFNDEIWVPITPLIIPNIQEGRYMVSSYGNFYDNNRGMYLTQYLRSYTFDENKSYLYVNLAYREEAIKVYGCGKRATLVSHLAHRIVAMAFIPGDWSLQVNHINGVKTDNRAINLEWVTIQENAIHAARTGLLPLAGERNTARFNTDQIHFICQQIQDGKSNLDILNSLGIPYSKRESDFIGEIRRGKKYKSVSSQYTMPENYPRVYAGIPAGENTNPYVPHPRERKISDDEARFICQCKQDDPSISIPQIINRLYPNGISGSYRMSIYNVIVRILNRQTFLDISKDYNW